MLYTGYFENRKREIINVTFNTGGDTETISQKDLRYINDGVNWTVHSKAGNVILQDPEHHWFFTSPAPLTNRLCKIRLYKDFTYKLTGAPALVSRYGYDYFITGLDSKQCYQYELECKTNNKSFTADRDGYLYVNIKDELDFLYLTRNGFKLATNEHIIGKVGEENTLLINGEENTLLIFGSEPVNVKSTSDGIFSAIKPLSATVSIMTPNIVKELYSPNSTSVSVEIVNNKTNEIIFKGFVTPCVYNQEYTYKYDTLEVECISRISALGNIRYQISQDKIENWNNILKDILNLVGYDCYHLQAGIQINGDFEFTRKIYINQDSLKTKSDNQEVVYYCKEILEKFCDTFSLSLIEYDGEPYFVDYGSLDGNENDFFKYNIGETEPEYEWISDYNFLSIDSKIGDTLFSSNSQDVSYDETYGSVNVKLDYNTIDDSVISFEQDDLICIHPNVDFLTFTAGELAHPEYYTKDGSGTLDFVDLYRFYIHKDFIHYYYPSKYSLTNKTYGVNDAMEFSKRYNSTSAATVKSEILSFLRSNLCCFVVQRLHYKNDTRIYYNPKDREYKPSWETNILFSYGLKNTEFGSYESKHDKAISDVLKNHFYEIEDKVLLETVDQVEMLKSTNYSAVQFNGEVMFLRYPLITESDTFTDSSLLRSYDVDEIKESNVCTSHWDAHIYKPTLVKGDKTTQTFNYCNYTYESLWTATLHSAGYKSEWQKAKAEFLYNWHPMQDTMIDFNRGFPDLSGYVFWTDGSYNGTIKITSPVPFFACVNAVPSYALVKDLNISWKKQYPILEIINGTYNRKEDIEVRKTGYSNKEELELELPYFTVQFGTPNINNGLMYVDNNEFKYISKLKYNGGVEKPLEEYILDKYITRYSQPRVIFECEVERNYWVNQLNLYSYSQLDVDLQLDSYEWNVIDDTIKLTLYEFVRTNITAPNTNKLPQQILPDEDDSDEDSDEDFGDDFYSIPITTEDRDYTLDIDEDSDEDDEKPSFG